MKNKDNLSTRKIVIDVKKWLFVISYEAAKEPLRFAFSVAAILIFGRILYASSGIIPMVGYTAVCLVYISKMMENPWKPIILGVGYLGTEWLSEIIQKISPEVNNSKFSSIPFIMLTLVILWILRSKLELLKKFDLTAGKGKTNKHI